MKRLLQFISLTTATQFCLLINQVVLLPLQVRVWGHDVTALWFFIVATANLAGMADLGLRNTAHAALLRSVRAGDPVAASDFRQSWALTRVLFAILTFGLVVAQIVICARLDIAISLWIEVVTIAIAIDTLVIVRGIWLDTLGHFNTVEAVFLGMVAMRVLLSAAVLAAFDAGPQTLGWIMLGTAGAAAVTQSWMVRTPVSLSFLAGGFLDLRWKSLQVIPLVVAEPATIWVRLSLPVIVLSVVSSPLFVTTYVAFRAIFSFARQIVGQFARYSSVRYVERADGDAHYAQRLVTRSILASMAISAAISSVTIADRGRLMKLWLVDNDAHAASVIALSFSFAIIACSYQVIAGVLYRSGDVAGVAKRQYVFLAVGAGAAAIGLAKASPNLYVMATALPDVVAAALFAPALGRRPLGASIVAFVCTVLLMSLFWLVAQSDPRGLFSLVTPFAIGASFALALATTVVVIVCCVAIDRSPFVTRSPGDAAVSL
jgi:hypothetical protein